MLFFICTFVLWRCAPVLVCFSWISGVRVIRAVVRLRQIEAGQN
jgi:hypothetical protein